MFVEGDLERIFISSNCKGLANRRLGNGVSVTIDALAKQIGAIWRVQSGGFRNLVVLLDREGRSVTSAEMAQQLLQSLKIACQGAAQIIVGCPDKMIENWILADHAVVTNYLGTECGPYAHEGKGGKGILKNLFRSVGRNYTEVSDGVTLLKRARPKFMSANSASAKTFFEQLNMDCFWLKADRA